MPVRAVADIRPPLSARLLVAAAVLNAALQCLLVALGRPVDVAWLSPALEDARAALSPISAAMFACLWWRALSRR